MNRTSMGLLILVFVTGMAIAATNSSEPPTSQKTPPSPNEAVDTHRLTKAEEAANLLAFEKRLKEAGFAKVEDAGDRWGYENKNIVLKDLLKVLGLESTDDFKQTLQAPPDKWVLRAEVPGGFSCLIEAPMPLVGAPDVPPESTHCMARVGALPPIPRVIKAGTPSSMGYVKALEKAGAVRVSSTYSRTEGKGEAEGDNRSIDRYRLPDGTCIQFSLELHHLEWDLVAISAGPVGVSFKDEREWAEAEKSGKLRKVDELDLSEYMKDSTKGEEAADILGFEKQLEEAGFTKVEDTSGGWEYANKDITLKDLVKVLGLKSTGDFKPIPNAPPDKWILMADVPGGFGCLIRAPIPRVGARGVPPESTHFTASLFVARVIIIPKVIKAGTPSSMGYVKALEKAGAVRVSSTYSRVEGKGENVGSNRNIKRYRLPNGTCVQFFSKARGKEWDIVVISVGPVGVTFKDEREWAEAEKSGKLRKVDELDLSEYMKDSAK